MAKYFVQVGYTSQAWSALNRGPQRVVERVQASAEALGGSIDSLFFCFGDFDLMGIVDFPDSRRCRGMVHGRKWRGRRPRIQDDDAANDRGGLARPRSGVEHRPRPTTGGTVSLTQSPLRRPFGVRSPALEVIFCCRAES